jgi:hypothetical protein
MAYRNNMNPMKLILVAIFATVIISMTLTGCKKCVSTEYEYVPVKITDAESRSAYSYPVRVGKQRQLELFLRHTIQSWSMILWNIPLAVQKRITNTGIKSAKPQKGN